LPSLKDQLEKALKYEQALFRLYQELASRLGQTELGQTCQLLASGAEDHITQIRRLVKACSG